MTSWADWLLQWCPSTSTHSCRAKHTTHIPTNQLNNQLTASQVNNQPTSKIQRTTAYKKASLRANYSFRRRFLSLIFLPLQKKGRLLKRPKMSSSPRPSFSSYLTALLPVNPLSLLPTSTSTSTSPTAFTSPCPSTPRMSHPPLLHLFKFFPLMEGGSSEELAMLMVKYPSLYFRCFFCNSEEKSPTKGFVTAFKSFTNTHNTK